ncbi:MAG: Ig-like domain-containing protein, partial [Oscillospiraceae bacterium]|nr:Ig-like domain-containing protein [Oscillospiraceae bacterium]
HAVYCTFSGKPELTTDEPNLKLKLGNDYRVTVNVAAEDSLLNDYVRENLVWSSNNTEAVEVDMYGNLKVKATGTAEITVTYGEAVLTITVTAGDENIDGTGSEGDGETGNGTDTNPGDDGTDSPSGEGDSGDNSGEQPNGSTKPAPKPAVPTAQPQPQDGAEQVSLSENSKGVYILSSELMTRTEYAEWVNSILEHDVTTDSSSGGVVNWREGEMDSDASALQVKINNVSAAPLYIGAGALFALGGAGEWLSFRIRLGKASNKAKKRA